MLIDDEAIIVEGLKRVVNWQRYGCEVVATAGNATEGAAVIRQFQPDIQFVDIRMPDQSGLTMLAGLRSEFPNLQVTVLTGYRDFSYAQEAVRLGVARLLLKPSRMEEIDEALLTMTQSLGMDALQEESPDSTESPEKCAGSFLVREALAYLNEHYPEKLTLQGVAEHCYVSQWHLSKLLNKHTGKSFYDLLNAIRIEEAKRLLRNPRLKIGEIGEMVGYSDAGHFARIFKKVEEKSANEYRNELG